MPLPSGARFGPYEILSPLGEGGMGEVYLARDTRLGRTVAIKSVKNQGTLAPPQQDRVEREARILAQLTHPHICTLYDIRQDGPQTLLVMEALSGGTLAARLDRLRGRGLPAAEAITLAAEAAEALAFAHRRGVIHQDIKPANIMLTPTGVKLLDFGIARLRQAGQPNDPSVTRAVTHDDLAGAGTLPYMAPEQLDGRTDPRSDIFALGAVLYEMLAGTRAFSGATPSALIAQIVEHDPPPLPPTAAPALDRIVRKCLAKDPDSRWQTASDLADELRWLAREDARPPNDAPVRRRVSTAVALGATAIASATIGAGMAWTRSSTAAAANVSFTVDAPAGATLLTYGDGGGPAISPDGSRVAFVATRADGTDLLWIRSLDSLTATPVAGSDGAIGPFWSPDSQQIAFFADSQLKRVTVANSSIQVVAKVDGISGTWNRDGDIIVELSNSTLGRLHLRGSDGPSPVAPPQAAGERRGMPTFLPDGRRFLYHAASPATPPSIYVGSLDDPTRTAVTTADSGAVFSSGSLLFVRGTELFAQGFDVDMRSLLGDARVVVTNAAEAAGRTRFSVSTNGVLAAGVGALPDTRLAWFNRQGTRIDVVPNSNGSRNPSLSPDNSRAVVNRRDAGTGTSELWLVDLARGVLTQLTRGPESRGPARWSPDGVRLASTVQGSFAPAVHDLESATTRSLSAGKEGTLRFGIVRDWSPDGASLLIHSTPGLWLLRPSGADAVKPVMTGSSTAVEGRFSPNGQWIAYSSGAGRLDIHLVAATGGASVQVSTAGGVEPVWRRDGKELFYLSLERVLMAVDVGEGSPPRLGAPRALFEVPTGVLWNAANHYDASEDGQRFLVAEERASPTPRTIAVRTKWTEVTTP